MEAIYKCATKIQSHLSVIDDISPEELDYFIKLLTENTFKLNDGKLANESPEYWITLPYLLTLPAIVDIVNEHNCIDNLEMLNMEIMRGRGSTPLCRFTKEELENNWTLDGLSQHVPPQRLKMIKKEIRHFDNFLLICKCLDIINGKYNLMSAINTKTTADSTVHKMIAIAYGYIHIGQFYADGSVCHPVALLAEDINVCYNGSFVHNDIIGDLGRTLQFAKPCGTGRMTVNISIYDFQIVELISAAIEWLDCNLVIMIDNDFISASTKPDANDEHILLLDTTKHCRDPNMLGSVLAAIRSNSDNVQLCTNQLSWTIREGQFNNIKFATVQMRHFLKMITTLMESSCRYTFVNVNNKEHNGTHDIETNVFVDETPAVTCSISILPCLPVMITPVTIDQNCKIMTFIYEMANNMTMFKAGEKFPDSARAAIGIFGRSVLFGISNDPQMISRYNAQLDKIIQHNHDLELLPESSTKDMLSISSGKLEHNGRVHPALLLAHAIYDNTADDINIPSMISVAGLGKNSMNAAMQIVVANGILDYDDEKIETVVERKSNRVKTIFDL